VFGQSTDYVSHCKARPGRPRRAAADAAQARAAAGAPGATRPAAPADAPARAPRRPSWTTRRPPTRSCWPRRASSGWSPSTRSGASPAAARRARAPGSAAAARPCVLVCSAPGRGADGPRRRRARSVPVKLEMRNYFLAYLDRCRPARAARARPACMHACCRARGGGGLPRLGRADAGRRCAFAHAPCPLACLHGGRCRVLAVHGTQAAAAGPGRVACQSPVGAHRPHACPSRAWQAQRAGAVGAPGPPGAADGLGWTPTRMQEDMRCGRWCTEGAGRCGQSRMQPMLLRHGGRLVRTDPSWAQAREHARAAQPRARPGALHDDYARSTDTAQTCGGRAIEGARLCG